MSAKDREFLPVNIALVTVSDSRTRENDTSGDTLEQRITDAGHTLVAREIVVDDAKTIQELFSKWAADPKIDCIISTGGTGLTGRDVTPEALKMVQEKEIEGFGELFRWISYQKIKTSTVQSRACAGVVNGTYVFCLPGSPGACKDGWDEILKDQLDVRHRPCNFVEIMPRLKEHLG